MITSVDVYADFNDCDPFSQSKLSEKEEWFPPALNVNQFFLFDFFTFTVTFIMRDQSDNVLVCVCSHRGDINPSPPQPPRKKRDKKDWKV